MEIPSPDKKNEALIDHKAQSQPSGLHPEKAPKKLRQTLRFVEHHPEEVRKLQDLDVGINCLLGLEQISQLWPSVMLTE